MSCGSQLAPSFLGGQLTVKRHYSFSLKGLIQSQKHELRVETIFMWKGGCQGQEWVVFFFFKKNSNRDYLEIVQSDLQNILNTLRTAIAKTVHL